MSTRVARVLATTICAICLITFVTSIPVGLAARDRIEPGQIVIVGDPTTPETQQLLEQLEEERSAGGALQETTAGFNPWFGALIFLLMVWLGVGLLIVWRQPGNWAGWLFLITGAPFPLLTLVQSVVVYGTKARPGSIPFLGLWAAIGDYLIYPVALLPLLFLLFPDGHPPSRRWRWAAIGLVGGTTLALLAFVVRPGPFNAYLADGILYENPLGIDALGAVTPVVILVGALIALGSALSTVVAVRQRFRAAVGEERQQMRWLVFVASIAGISFVLQWVLGVVGEIFFTDEDAPIFELFFALTALTIVLGIPAAYLVAILRHGLWDLDVVVKKTVQYGVLVIGLLMVAVLFLVGASALVVGRGGGVPSGLILGLVAGIVVALLVVALRIPARRLADRIVYGGRATPYEVLSEFTERVGDTYSTNDVLPRMAQLLGEATGARAARVWLHVGETMRAAASWPIDAPPAPEVVPGTELPSFGGEDAFEVRHHGELLGALTVSPAPDDPIDAKKERLARDMAAQAGLVLRNVRLIEDLRESRRRIVAAQDERAKKLERNIHDGAQQQLVALAVKLRLADSVVERDPTKAHELLADLQTHANETLEDLRDLARGIYPPLLADQGLPAALESQARRSPTPVTIEPDGLGRYGQDVEAAIYFACLEALNNVAKYAEATSARITLSHEDGGIRFEVHDDGRGFDPTATPRGTGLQGIADRIAAVGGRVAITSRPGEGTDVAGWVPVG